VKSIIKYVACDGAEFTDARACQEHERLLREIALITDRLVPSPPSGANEFAQQHKATFLSVQRDLVLIFERLHPAMIDQHTEWARYATIPAGMTLIGRYMDDAGPTALYAAWNRIMCTDKHFREWGQPYYALEANKRLP
jgi:hypothetical protein